MTDITHPIEKGTKVQYLSPKCGCQGGGYQLNTGVVTNTIVKRGKYIYNITTSRHRIPAKGVIKILE